MPSLARRSTDPEQLDAGVPEAEALKSLGDLRFVNRYLGGMGNLWRAARPYLSSGAGLPRLLDVGCGSADLPAYLRARLGGRLLAVGLDVKAIHVSAAPAEIRTVVADVRRLPFAPRSFDVVTASLFLHHFDEPELPGLLRSLHDLARRALIVNDLERSAVAYWFGRLTFPWLFRSRVSVEDGLVSIRRGFHRPELEQAFREAGIPVRVARRFPYRLVAVAERSATDG